MAPNSRPAEVDRWRAVASRWGALLGFAVLIGAGTPVVTAPAASAAVDVQDQATTLPAPPIRELAAGRGVRFGTATGPAQLRDDSDYAAIVREQFDLLAPENAMKWDAIRPEPGRFDFTDADAIVAVAEANGQAVRGHTLVWHSQNPAWLTALTPTRTEASALLEDHISTVMGRYRGRVGEWDVVNEALDDAGPGLRTTIWQQWIGDDYLDIAFRLARAADPDARLIYNDYDAAGVGAKSQRIIDLAVDMKRRGIPIDGVGLQFHLFGDVDETALSKLMDQAEAAGLTVSLTELDVSLALPTSAKALEVQADRFGAAVRGCVAAAPTCASVTLWGFTDRYSWVPTAFPGLGEATPLDERLGPKPAWFAIREAFERSPAEPTTTTPTVDPSTNTTTTTTPAPTPAPGTNAAAPAIAVDGQADYTG